MTARSASLGSSGGDKIGNASDDLVDGEAGGVELDGALGWLEWGVLAGRVLRVAESLVAQDGVDLDPKLGGAAAGPLGRGADEDELHGGDRRHDGADPGRRGLHPAA